MAYILGLIIVILFFLALHYFTELTTSQKAITTGITLSIIFGAIAYNSYTNAQQEKMLNVVIKYNQDKTIKCNNLDINKSNFTLSIGTYTFIGKEGTPYYSQMISASECE